MSPVQLKTPGAPLPEIQCLDVRLLPSTSLDCDRGVMTGRTSNSGQLDVTPDGAGDRERTLDDRESRADARDAAAAQRDKHAVSVLSDAESATMRPTPATLRQRNGTVWQA